MQFVIYCINCIVCDRSCNQTRKEVHSVRNLKRFALQRKVLFIRVAAFLFPMIFAMLLLSQTAFAKNTYVITDGSRVFTYTTYATDPMTVLDEAGLELDENDTYTTQAGIGSAEITIQRNQKITIYYHGEQMQASSFGETVEELLIRLNISLDANDVVSWPLDDETFDGMQLRIDQVLHLEQIYTSTISHGTSYCYDANLPAGMEEVITHGVDGEMLCTATVTYVNGVEKNRTVLTQSVSRRAVEEVIAIGTGMAATKIRSTDMPVITEDKIYLPTGEVLSYTKQISGHASAYYNQGTTATGTEARSGVAAVDPRFLPFGTRMFIVTNDGAYIYGIARAEDAGDGNIVGDRIDLWFPTREECIQFGIRDITIYILGTDP